MEKFLIWNHDIFSFNYLLLRVEAQLAKTWGFVYGRVEKEKSVIVERYWEEVIEILYTVSGTGHSKLTYKIVNISKPNSQIKCIVYGLKIRNNWNHKKKVKLCQPFFWRFWIKSFEQNCHQIQDSGHCKR